MSQQSMFPQEPRQDERLYNSDPREQGYQQRYREQAPPGVQAGESGYEAGYQGGYEQHGDETYMQGEKLRPKPPGPQSWQIILFILIVFIVGIGTGAIGSFFSAMLGFVVGVLGLIIAGVIVMAAVSTRPVALPTRTFEVAERASLAIHNDAGNVRIRRGEGNRVEVRGTSYVSKLFGESSQPPIFYTQNGDSISINARHWSLLRFFSIGYVTLDITVPATSDVQMQNDAGTIDIIGINGQVNARTNAGTILVAGADLGAGSFLQTNAGTITVRQSTLEAGTRGHTDAGTINIVQSRLRGGASFDTNLGTITFSGSLAPDGDYTFKTNAGTVDVNLPADSSFTLKARTSLGTVHNDFSGDSVGEGPYARLTLESDMGNVSVRRSAAGS